MRVNTSEELNATLKKEHGKIVVVKFGAEWCAACNYTTPEYSDMLRESADFVVFVDADHDDAIELFEEYEIKEIPTFLFFKKSTLERRLTRPKAHDIRITLRQECHRPRLVLDEDF